MAESKLIPCFDSFSAERNISFISPSVIVLQEDLPFFGPRPIALVFSPSTTFFYHFPLYRIKLGSCMR